MLQISGRQLDGLCGVQVQHGLATSSPHDSSDTKLQYAESPSPKVLSPPKLTDSLVEVSCIVAAVSATRRSGHLLGIAGLHQSNTSSRRGGLRGSGRADELDICCECIVCGYAMLCGQKG